MTSTTAVYESQLHPLSQRWPGVVIGLLIGLAAVCHGCHSGDHDDELSLSGGKSRFERRRDADTSPERQRGVSPTSLEHK